LVDICQSRSGVVNLFSLDTGLAGSSHIQDLHLINKLAVGGWPPRYICPPSPPLWAPKCLVPPSRQQRSSSFPRPTCSHAHRCSHLMRQHGGKQSGLVTLTLKVVSESHVIWATSVLILVFLGLSVLDLGPMHATDKCQTASSLYAPPIRGGSIIMQAIIWDNGLIQHVLRPQFGSINPFS